jgi:hypothetical protein
MIGAGATIGSAVPGIGTAVGAAIGLVIGSAIAAIFGGKEWSKIHAYHQEIDNIYAAMGRLHGAGSAVIIRSDCQAFFEVPELSAPLKQMHADVLASASTAATTANDIAARAQAIEQNYSVALATLIRDDLPTFQRRFELAFRRFLDTQAETSAKSKTYFSKKILPALSLLHRTDVTSEGRLAAQQQLWEDLIEGDIQFSSDGEFCFSPPPAHQQELLYWGPATRSLVNSLREGALK